MNVDQLGIPIAGVFGAMFGSFLNVLILRLPHEESIVFPGSHCPRCQTPIAWYDNVPLLSWLLLGGKCRHCREPISIQYPIIELITAALWAAAVWYYGANLTGLTAAVFGTLLLGIAVTDARHYLIPDEYTLGGLVVGLLLSLRGRWPGLLQAVLGAVTGFLILYIVAVAGKKVFGKEAMGGGDVKMMAMVGAFVGWRGVLLTIFVGSLLGTVVFVPLSLRQKRLVPFGIFLAAAAALTFVLGDAMISWYLDWVLGG